MVFGILFLTMGKDVKPRTAKKNQGDPVPLEKIGKYEIIRELGKGAMGIVYEARDPQLGRSVAVKTIRFDAVSDPALLEELRKRFVREAQSAGNLHHANIVTIHEIGEDQGSLFFVMEYVEGQSLEKKIAAKTKLTPDEVVGLLRPVAEALDYAHRKGIIHRDIKPANILIDGEGRPRIVDFGIAHVSSSTITQTGMALGTPSYMAPEQIVGQKLDGRADVFSLGVILYELLTLQKPFPGDNVTTIIYKIMNEDPRPPRDLDHGVPPGLESVVRKALAKNPDLRYQTAGELVADLKDYAKIEGDRSGADPAAADKTVVFRDATVSRAPAKPRKSPLALGGALAAVGLVVVAAVFLLSKKEPVSTETPETVSRPQAEATKKAEPKTPPGASGAPAKVRAEVKPAEKQPQVPVAKPSEGAKPQPPESKKPEAAKTDDPAGDEPRPVRAIGDIKAPKILKEVAPIYPEAARKAGTKGFVILEVTTDSRGRVTNAKVLRSLPGCDQAAIDAVRRYVYEPVIIRGRPRGVIFSVTVFFKSP